MKRLESGSEKEYGCWQVNNTDSRDHHPRHIGCLTSISNPSLLIHHARRDGSIDLAAYT